jgi:D-alanyl-D-alanine carboxypeptidase
MHLGLLYLLKLFTVEHNNQKIIYWLRMIRLPKNGPKLLIAAAAMLLVMSVTYFSNPAEAKPNKKYASLVVDADTGAILFQRNPDKVLHPASLVKIMTLIVLFDEIEKGNISLRDRIYISRNANKMVPSKLNLPVGSSIRVEDAIYALVTKSANDVAVAIAEHVAQSEKKFVYKMNRKARDFGMSRTRYTNASGLHDDKQVSSARDQVKLGRALIYSYSKYYHYFSTQRFTYRGVTYRNHNRLMETYVGMDGLKTGYIQRSGFNLLASVRRNDVRLISVVFGGRSSRSRNKHMADILDRSFKKYGTMLISHAKKAPRPIKKPLQDQQVASLASLSPASGTPSQPSLLTARSLVDEATRWADLNTFFEGGAIQAIVGEGDLDPDEIKRIRTGWIAISAVKGLYKTPIKKQEPQGYSFRTEQKNLGASYKDRPTASEYDKKWGIQIGAFRSRIKTEHAIEKARARLPLSLSSDKAIIAPFETGKDKWIYRARLSGYTKHEAQKACKILKECLIVAPQ